MSDAAGTCGQGWKHEVLEIGKVQEKSNHLLGLTTPSSKADGVVIC